MWHPYTLCPKCYSQVRHRLLIAALSDLRGDLSSESLLKNKKVIHFAPEPEIERFIRQYTNDYLSADLHQVGCDLKIDIAAMPEVEAEEYDLLIACDVLEHIDDDKRAMGEIYRVLRQGGWAVFTVPQKDNLQKTYEDKSVTDPADRERSFGQADHVRIYGHDFPQRLEEAGFEVKIVTEKRFSQHVIDKFVLFPPIRSDNSLATNFRKIFFARKPASK